MVLQITNETAVRQYVLEIEIKFKHIASCFYQLGMLQLFFHLKRVK